MVFIVGLIFCFVLEITYSYWQAHYTFREQFRLHCFGVAIPMLNDPHYGDLFPSFLSYKRAALYQRWFSTISVLLIAAAAGVVAALPTNEYRVLALVPKLFVETELAELQAPVRYLYVLVLFHGMALVILSFGSLPFLAKVKEQSGAVHQELVRFESGWWRTVFHLRAGILNHCLRRLFVLPEIDENGIEYLSFGVISGHCAGQYALAIRKNRVNAENYGALKTRLIAREDAGLQPANPSVQEFVNRVRNSGLNEAGNGGVNQKLGGFSAKYSSDNNSASNLEKASWLADDHMVIQEALFLYGLPWLVASLEWPLVRGAQEQTALLIELEIVTETVSKRIRGSLINVRSSHATRHLRRDKRTYSSFLFRGNPSGIFPQKSDIARIVSVDGHSAAELPIGCRIERSDIFRGSNKSEHLDVAAVVQDHQWSQFTSLLQFDPA